MTLKTSSVVVSAMIAAMATSVFSAEMEPDEKASKLDAVLAKFAKEIGGLETPTRNTPPERW